eukprot:811349_1
MSAKPVQITGQTPPQYRRFRIPSISNSWLYIPNDPKVERHYRQKLIGRFTNELAHKYTKKEWFDQWWTIYESEGGNTFRNTVKRILKHGGTEEKRKKYAEAMDKVWTWGSTQERSKNNRNFYLESWKYFIGRINEKDKEKDNEDEENDNGHDSQNNEEIVDVEQEEKKFCEADDGNEHDVTGQDDGQNTEEIVRDTNNRTIVRNIVRDTNNRTIVRDIRGKVEEAENKASEADDDYYDDDDDDDDDDTQKPSMTASKPTSKRLSHTSSFSAPFTSSTHTDTFQIVRCDERQVHIESLSQCHPPDEIFIKTSDGQLHHYINAQCYGAIQHGIGTVNIAIGDVQKTLYGMSKAIRSTKAIQSTPTPRKHSDGVTPTPKPRRRRGPYKGLHEVCDKQRKRRVQDQFNAR